MIMTIKPMRRGEARSRGGGGERIIDEEEGQKEVCT